MAEKPAVLFVCLGNICRSPLAEGAFRQQSVAAGLEVEIDSAGTGGWHAGNPPDPRARLAAREAGFDISDLRARQLVQADFDHFDHILAMDAQNLADIRAFQPTGSRARISLLLDHVPGREGASIADPYYGGEEDFAATVADAQCAARALVGKLA
jgi:protein-tyrosine phosphatase